MMRLRRNNEGSPSIFADLLIETADGMTRIDPDIEGWLYVAKPLFKKAIRVGLARHHHQPEVWLAVLGGQPAYFSRVIGQMDMQGGNHKQTRVAAIEVQRGNVDYTAWLHDDGTVEVGPEPTVR